MSKKIKLDVEVDGIKDVERLNKSVEELTDNMSDVGKETTNAMGDVEDATKKAAKGVEKAGDAAKKSGSAAAEGGKRWSKLGNILATGLGIGIVIKLFQAASEILMQNQEVVDAVNKVFTTLSIIVNQVINVFKDAFTQLGETNGGFDATKTVITNLIKLALTPLKVSFELLKLTMYALQLAWESSMFGGQDQDKMDELNAKITESKDRLVELKDEAIESGVAIKDNAVEAFHEMKDVTEKVAEGLGEVFSEDNIKKTYKQASGIVENTKNLEKLAIQQETIIEQYDYQAETQRQIRDDETKSFAQRIEANAKLGAILTEQAQFEKDSLAERIGIIQQQQALLGKTDERENEILSLKKEVFAVEARINGQRSEQLVSTNALLKEQADAEQAKLDAEAERLAAHAVLVADYALREADLLVANAETARALIAEEEAAAIIKAEQKLVADNEALRLALESDILTKAEYDQLALVNKQEHENAINVIEQTSSDKRKKIADEEAAAKKAAQARTLQAASDTLSTISSLATLFANSSEKSRKKAFKVQKAASIAQAGIETYKSATSAFSSLAGIPVVGPVLGGIAAAAAVAAGLVNIKKIASTKFESGSTPSAAAVPSMPSIPSSSSTAGGGSSTSTAPTPESLSLFGDAFEGSEGEGSQEAGARQQTIKAIVVESDITEVQSRMDTIAYRSEIG